MRDDLQFKKMETKIMEKIFWINNGKIHPSGINFGIEFFSLFSYFF